MKIALVHDHVGGPTHVVLGSADQVGVNPLARLVAKRAGATIETVPGGPHELSQEWHDRRVVDAIAGVALGTAR